jgi:protein-lysine N-methyltransferase EEF2KMT
MVSIADMQRELPSQSYKTYIWHRTPTVHANDEPGTLDEQHYRYTTLLESGTTVENGTTGMRTWSASFMLSAYIISHPGKPPNRHCVYLKDNTNRRCAEIVVGKRVIELGCGVGLVGAIVADQQLASSGTTLTCGSICLTDLDNRVLRRCRENLELPCSQFSAFITTTFA